MRLEIFSVGDYYHILGRGNYKQKIFFDENDYLRFLFSILHFQLPIAFPNLSREVGLFSDFLVQHSVLNKEYFDSRINNYRESLEKRNVDLINFGLMPNHYHLTLKEIIKNGISRYMQRVLNSFTKYHNTKYEKTGHLFQGPFRAVYVDSLSGQLPYLSAYIHQNPKEIGGWKGKEDQYPWSSYQDYLYKNRWGELLKSEPVLKHFRNADDYKKFVDDCEIKELDLFNTEC